MADQTLITELSKYSSCDVADALQKLGHPQGGFLSGITLWSPQRQEGSTKIVGPAYTVQYVPKGQEVSAVQGHYIDSIPASSILFISSPQAGSTAGPTNAVYGGLMSTRAKALGVGGVIVDGRIRDLQEHRDLGFPVWARDVGVASPGPVWMVGSVNSPIHLSSRAVTIEPGDYLLADLNGVVHIPQDRISKVLALIRSQVEADERIAADVKAGKSFGEASTHHRKSVKKAQDV